MSDKKTGCFLFSFWAFFGPSALHTFVSPLLRLVMNGEVVHLGGSEPHSLHDSDSPCLNGLSKWKRFFMWMYTFYQAYGSVIAYYGASYGAFLSALSVPLLNE